MTLPSSASRRPPRCDLPPEISRTMNGFRLSNRRARLDSLWPARRRPRILAGGRIPARILGRPTPENKASRGRRPGKSGRIGESHAVLLTDVIPGERPRLTVPPRCDTGRRHSSPPRPSFHPLENGVRRSSRAGGVPPSSRRGSEPRPAGRAFGTGIASATRRTTGRPRPGVGSPRPAPGRSQTARVTVEVPGASVPGSGPAEPVG
jgi:hypothetical protein